MNALILTSYVSVGWPFLTSKFSRAASKIVESSSGDMLSWMAYRSCCGWPIGVG